MDWKQFSSPFSDASWSDRFAGLLDDTVTESARSWEHRESDDDSIMSAASLGAERLFQKHAGWHPESNPGPWDTEPLASSWRAGSKYPAFVSAQPNGISGIAPTEFLSAISSLDSVSPMAFSDSGPQALTNVFALHSKANAKHTIYLDFNGHTTSNTDWNTDYNNGKSFTTPAFSTDASSAFSASEQELILNIWRRVSEDFRPFNVDVTTAAPSTDRLIKSSVTDQRWGVRVVIGGSASGWLGGQAAGISYLDSFNWASDTPAFIFTKDFFITDKNVAEAITHEVGHTLGLMHDGRNTPKEEYYAGHGSGDTGWAPIMGLGYYQTLTQWSRGEYGSASNRENDLQIITTQNGFGFRDDDHGNATGNASILQLSNNNLIELGIIERNNDVDFFSFGIQTTGSYQMNVLPFFKGPNLDLGVTLFSDDGTAIRSYNKADELGVTERISLSVGHYYMRVQGVGKSGPNGYSNYGSLGNYSIRIIPIGFDITTPNIQIYQQSSVKEEGNSGFTNFTFRLVRQGNLKIESTVNWQVRGTSDTNSVDRFDFRNDQFASGVAKFQYGNHLAFITVSVKADLVWEPHERMQVVISNAFNGKITKNSVVGTILNDDQSGSNLILPQGPGAPQGLFASASSSSEPLPSTLHGLDQLVVEDETSLQLPTQEKALTGLTSDLSFDKTLDSVLRSSDGDLTSGIASTNDDWTSPEFMKGGDKPVICYTYG